MKAHIAFVLFIVLAIFSPNTYGIQIDSSPKRLKQYQKSSQPYAILFEAEWCTYCKKLLNLLVVDESISELLEDIPVIRLDVDKYPKLAQTYIPNNAALPQFGLYVISDNQINELVHFEGVIGVEACYDLIHTGLSEISYFDKKDDNPSEEIRLPLKPVASKTGDRGILLSFEQEDFQSDVSLTSDVPTDAGSIVVSKTKPKRTVNKPKSNSPSQSPSQFFQSPPPYPRNRPSAIDILNDYLNEYMNCYPSQGSSANCKNGSCKRP